MLQHRDAAAERHRLGLIVGDVDGRGRERALQLRDLGPHLHAKLGVEVGQRLVHQEGPRLAHDRPAHRHPLPLAAGQLPRLALKVGLELEDPRGLGHPLLHLGLRHALRYLRLKAMLS